MKKKKIWQRVIVNALSISMVASGSLLPFAMESSYGQDTRAVQGENEQQQVKERFNAEFVKGTKRIITSGGSSIVKSEDGNTYTISPFNGFNLLNSFSVNQNLGADYKILLEPEDDQYISRGNKYFQFNIKKRNKRGEEDKIVNFKAKVYRKEDFQNRDSVEPVYTWNFKVQLVSGPYKFSEIKVKFVDRETGEEIPTNKLLMAELKLNGKFSQYNKDKKIFKVFDDTDYEMTVIAQGYKDYMQSFNANGQEEYVIPLEAKEKKVKVAFDVVDENGDPIDDATVTVNSEGKYVQKVEGTYALSVGKTYTYSVSKDGYTSVSNTFVAGNEKNKKVVLTKEKAKEEEGSKPAEENKEKESPKVEEEHAQGEQGNQGAEGNKENTANTSEENMELLNKIVNLLKTKAAWAKIDPKAGEDTNIETAVFKLIKHYDPSLNLDGVKVKVLSSTEEDTVALDGKITYVTGAINGISGSNHKNVRLGLEFSKGDSKVDLGELITARVGRSLDDVNEKLKEEADKLTEEAFHNYLGEENKESVVKGFTLPQYLGENNGSSWSNVQWTSSDEKTLKIEKDDSIHPAKVKVSKPGEDKEVTLTAKISVNTVALNTYIQSPDDFNTITKEFKVKVKGDEKAKTSKEDLEALLDKWFKKEDIKALYTKEDVDLNNLTVPVGLWIYTRRPFYEGNKPVFENHEINYSTDNPDLIKIENVSRNKDEYHSAYSAFIDPFTKGSKEGNIIITFTRDGVTATKKIPVKAGLISDEELEKEISILEKLNKEEYYKAIKGENLSDPNKVTKNLVPFYEVYLDDAGNLVFGRDPKNLTRKGLIVDRFYDDYAEMEKQNTRLFRSSEASLVTPDTLEVTRGKEKKKVIVSSKFTSAKYGHSAELHKDNSLLKKLYKIAKYTAIYVPGENEKVETLDEKIDSKVAEGQELLGKIEEGQGEGKYQEGTKALLEEAIAKLKAAKEEGNKEEAIEAFDKVIDEVSNRENPAERSIVVNLYNGKENWYFGKFTAVSNASKKYGHLKPKTYTNKVTPLDVVLMAHRNKIGEDFDKNPNKYIEGDNFITKFLGENTSHIGFYVNGLYPTYKDDPTTGSTWNDTELKDGDLLTAFIYDDKEAWTDMRYFFTKSEYKGNQGEDITVQLFSNSGFGGKSTNREGINLVAEKDGKEIKAVTGKDGIAKFNFKEAGTYTVSLENPPEKRYIPSKVLIVVEPKENLEPPTPTPSEEKPAENETKSLDTLKEEAKAEIEGLTHLQSMEKTKYYGQLMNAKNSHRVEEILNNAKALDRKRAEASKIPTPEEETLQDKKGEATEALGKLTNLSDNKANEYLEKIEKAKTIDEVDSILKEAEAENSTEAGTGEGSTAGSETPSGEATGDQGTSGGETGNTVSGTTEEQPAGESGATDGSTAGSENPSGETGQPSQSEDENREALEDAKNDGKLELEKLNKLSETDYNGYVDRIDDATTVEQVEGIVAEAKAKNAEAEDKETGDQGAGTETGNTGSSTAEGQPAGDAGTTDGSTAGSENPSGETGQPSQSEDENKEALEDAKNDGKLELEKLNKLSETDYNGYVDRIDDATTVEQVEAIVAEAKAKNAEAEGKETGNQGAGTGSETGNTGAGTSEEQPATPDTTEENPSGEAGGQGAGTGSETGNTGSGTTEEHPTEEPGTTGGSTAGSETPSGETGQPSQSEDENGEALEDAKNDGKLELEKLNKLSETDYNGYVDRIDEATTVEQIEAIVAEAKAKNAEAEGKETGDQGAGTGSETGNTGSGITGEQPVTPGTTEEKPAGETGQPSQSEDENKEALEDAKNDGNLELEKLNKLSDAEYNGYVDRIDDATTVEQVEAIVAEAKAKNAEAEGKETGDQGTAEGESGKTVAGTAEEQPATPGTTEEKPAGEAGTADGSTAGSENPSGETTGNQGAGTGSESGSTGAGTSEEKPAGEAGTTDGSTAGSENTSGEAGEQGAGTGSESGSTGAGTSEEQPAGESGTTDGSTAGSENPSGETADNQGTTGKTEGTQGSSTGTIGKQETGKPQITVTPKDKNLVVTKVESISQETLASISSPEAKAKVESMLKGDYEVYEVTLDGSHNGSETYLVAIPYNVSKEVVKIAHIRDNGEVEFFGKDNFTLKDGKVYVESKGLSPFIVEYKTAVESKEKVKVLTNASKTNKAPKTGDKGMTLNLTLLLASTSLLLRKKRRDK